jgi:Flp pilus assembly protein TadD
MGKGERITWSVLLGIFICILGFVLGRTGKSSHAEMDPKRSGGHSKEEAMMQASARFTVQDWRGAEEQYTKAVEADPGDWATWHGRALARVGIGDFSGALGDFDRAVALNGSMANLYDHRGVAKAKLCRWEDAVGDFNRAIAMKPNDGGYHLHRAQALEHRGDLRGAQSDYEKAVELIQAFDFMHQVASQRLIDLRTRRAQTYY